MDSAKKLWMVTGAFLLGAISILQRATGAIDPFLPMPFYILVLAWLAPVGYAFVFPVLYLIQFYLLYRLKSFGIVTLVLSLVISLLNIYYFYAAWDYGVRWQGRDYVNTMVNMNIVASLTLLLLCFVAIKKKSVWLIYSANLFLFVIISWCAFPVLGELP